MSFDKKVYSQRYYQAHKKRIAKLHRRYYKAHREELNKYEVKRRKTHKLTKAQKLRSYDRVRIRKGITSKSKCIYGCKVPWRILERHHLTKTQSVIFCPNHHRLYHLKHGKKKA